MLSNASLKKTGSRWEFSSEEILEDFLYEHYKSPSLTFLLSQILSQILSINTQWSQIIS
ncbi:hypothetical protein [Dapis sp. BLCC M229]|uniref:hypothetical protein n=1 Tax=Dapis sp. BLCC M229 TaxID=3400188 RepID=UPI003CF69FAD